MSRVDSIDRSSKNRAMSGGGARILVATAIAVIGCGPSASEREVCGYRCGPAGECPDGFACYADGRCHREGSPESRGCTIDGGPDTAPSISAADPGDNETGWPTTRAIEITFDEPVVGVETAITLRHRSEFDPVPAVVSYSEETRTATLVPTDPLEKAATYVITVAPTLTDATGNPYAGRSWEFTTLGDTIAPQLVSVSPSPGTVNVGVETPLVITFDEPVQGVTQSSFMVANASTGASAGEITYLSPLLVKQAGQWAPNTLYRVSLTSAITDLAANPLGQQTWLFMTGPDTVAPRITYQRPHIDAQEVPMGTDVEVFFSESMSGISLETVYLDRDGVVVPSTMNTFGSDNVVQLVPVDDLAPNATYRVTILPAVKDLAGNPIAPGVLTWTFTTRATP